MKSLIEISKIVTKKRISKVDIFNKSLLNKKDSKFNEFYEGLVMEKFKTDEEAARVLYNTTPQDDRYRQLKSRFSKRLLTTLFFLDSNDAAFSDYHSAYYTCNKQWSLVRILLSSGARNAAMKIISKTITVAEQYRFSDIILNCARILMSNASLKGNDKEYNIYASLTKKSLRDLEYEISAEEMYQRLTIHFAISSGVNLESAAEADKYLEKVKNLCEKSDSYILHFTMHQIKILSFQLKGDYKNTLKACVDAEEYLNANKPFNQKIRHAALALIKISCYLQLREYVNGKKNAEKCLDLFEAGSNNWFVFLEYYFLLSMRTENFMGAAGIFLKVINHVRFPFTNEDRQEKWKIFEAYLNYIFETENLNKDLLTDANRRKFRLLKFLNEVPHFTKDKKGYNVAILIIQILYLLEKGDYIGIIDRSEALQVYCNRYLRKDDAFRSSCFLKMLLLIEKEDFKYERIKQAASKYQHKLAEGEPGGNNHVHEWEIIPYETLWEKVLNRLKNKQNPNLSLTGST